MKDKNQPVEKEMFEWEDVGTVVGEGICKPILVLGICCARNYKVYVFSEMDTTLIDSDFPYSSDLMKQRSTVSTLVFWSAFILIAYDAESLCQWNNT